MGHNHAHAPAGTATAKHHKRLLIVVGITAAVFVAQVVGGLVSGSLALLADAGPFCAGGALSFADACLASHVAGAERFKVDLTPFPAVRAIHDRCAAMPEFARAHPLRQPGASG